MQIFCQIGKYYREQQRNLMTLKLIYLLMECEVFN